MQFTGQINSREFKAAFRALGFEITKEDVIKLFAEADKDLDSKLCKRDENIKSL